jgi:hypothetical protein
VFIFVFSLVRHTSNIYRKGLKCLPGSCTIKHCPFYSLIFESKADLIYPTLRGTTTLSITILRITTFSIMTLSIKGLCVTVSTNDT